VLERGGIKIAVVSLTPQSAIKENGVSISEPIGTAEKTLAPLLKDVDLVVALSQLGNAQDQELAKRLPAAHIIVGSDLSMVTENPFWYDKAILVDSQAFGYLLGRLDLDLAFPFKGFFNNEEIALTQKRIKEMEARVASGKADEGLASRLTRTKQTSQLGPQLGGSEYRHQHIKLTKEKYGKKNELTQAIAKEKERVRREALKE